MIVRGNPLRLMYLIDIDVGSYQATQTDGSQSKDIGSPKGSLRDSPTLFISTCSFT